GFSDIRTVQFDYSGGETGDSWISLDAREDPPIMVRFGRFTGKILELTFGRAISIGELPAIGERLSQCARGTSRMATRFNYQMIAAILQNWIKVVERID